MAKQALIVWGGWNGHTPQACAELFKVELEAADFNVSLENTLDVFTDTSRLQAVDLIVPIWTMGDLSKEQRQGLIEAVHNGAGLAGFHGGVLDAFRNHPQYQFMIGGQWVSHPGNADTQYTVRISDNNHPITDGLNDFELERTEQYYLHLDPGVHVLCETTFTGEYGDASTYPNGVVMPYAWTCAFGSGRVFVAAWGHTDKDFDVPEARELVKRGMVWASR